MTTPLRCAECLTYEHLHGATDTCSVHGSIGPDGDFEYADFEAPDGPDFASVECSEHPGAGLHYFVNDAWCLPAWCDDSWHDVRASWPRPCDLPIACPTCGSWEAGERRRIYRPLAAALGEKNEEANQ